VSTRLEVVHVKLTRYELFMGAMTGVRREIEALVRGLPERHGAKKEHGWTLHIEGALGELAVAKVLNQFWSGTVNTFKAGGDLGSRVQIRTRSERWHELIVRDDDADDARYVLVVGTAPEYDVVGSKLGREARRAEWRKPHGGREEAYFVPQDQLDPVVHTGGN